MFYPLSDCVHLSPSFNQLQSYGMRGSLNKWHTSYLEGRRQCVQIENSLSTQTPITYGVPQGQIIGPILFIMYVNNEISYWE